MPNVTFYHGIVELNTKPEGPMYFVWQDLIPATLETWEMGLLDGVAESQAGELIPLEGFPHFVCESDFDSRIHFYIRSTSEKVLPLAQAEQIYSNWVASLG